MSNTLTKADNRSVQERHGSDQRRGWLQPQVNIAETPDGYVLEAEMPGVGKDGLEISLEANEAKYYYNRGNAKTYIADLKGAIPDFDKVISLEPNYINEY